jgi:hypothetical protein
MLTHLGSDDGFKRARRLYPCNQLRHLVGEKELLDDFVLRG